MIATAPRLATLAVVGALALGAQTAAAATVDIKFRNFSPASAAMGPPANAYGVKLEQVTQTALGPSEVVRFTPLPGTPAIPAAFKGSIVAAVGAGAANGGFDAAYNSGSELNKAWGFLVNSGVPFGTTWDEFLGFLYGRDPDSGLTGMELVQHLLDLRSSNVVVFPLVANAEQLSGYFSEPVGDVPGHKGIGLEGLCQRPWTFRYLPPGENVLGLACDQLVAEGVIPAKNIRFIAAIPGGGSLVNAVKIGQLQGFEFATPLDDVSTLFNTVDNPGTVGVRYVHLPGWQQQFLVTWMIVNKQVWNGLTPAQQVLALTVARDHVVSTYGENLRKQGPALEYILNANQADADAENDMVLSIWPDEDQSRLRAAAIRYLNARADDTTLSVQDRDDYLRVLEAMRTYVHSGDRYWDRRQVPTRERFEDWTSSLGDPWEFPSRR